MTARFIVGDTRAVLDTLEPGSVDLVLSSPPFLALRSYLPADHPDKAFEIGSEASPADFLDTLLDVTEACARVLAPHGSLVFELGDTYSGSGGAGGDYRDQGLRVGQNAFDGSARRQRVAATDRQRQLMDPHEADDGKYDGDRLRDRRRVSHNGNKNRDKAPGWPLDKSLCGIPTLFAWSLAYGRNLLRPERATDPWRIRNVVAWCRPNPPVGALGDKFRPAASYLTVACKARDRWFDLDAVRTEPQRGDGTPYTAHQVTSTDYRGDPNEGGARVAMVSHPSGAPPLDYWEIPTQGYKGSHYATWPARLCVRPVEAMCPREVCTACGSPRRRIVEGNYAYDPRSGQREFDRTGAGRTTTTATTATTATTLGWSDCECGAPWRRGVVLDPFAGSGTTLAVAEGLGRDSVGIDFDARNADLARERVGMFLTVEQFESEGAA